MIKVSDYITNFLYNNGIRNVYTLSGGGAIHLDDSLLVHKGVEGICIRNEATSGMMAEGGTKLGGEIGAVYTTTGPGGANAVTGVVESFVDSSPVIFISGQVFINQTTYNADIYNLRTFGMQELNIIKVVDSITKYSTMIRDPNKIKYYMEKAIHMAISGRPGPVWLDVPLDVQSALVDEDNLEGYNPEYDNIEIENDKIIDDINMVVNLLLNAKNPVILSGQGIKISKSEDLLDRLVRDLNIPVIFSRMGLDIFPFSHKYNMGLGGVRGLKHNRCIMAKSDLIINLGSSLSVAFVGFEMEYINKDASVISVDIDKAELDKHKNRIDVPVNCDLNRFMRKLMEKVEENNIKIDDNWIDECSYMKKNTPIVNDNIKENPIDIYHFVNRLDELSNENHVFVSDAGSIYYVTGQTLKFERGQKDVCSGAYASMGLTVPLSIGCALYDKSKQIIALTGDGSIETNIQELKTLSSYGLNVKLFVINNGGYISIKDHQDILFDGRYFNSDQSDDEMLDFKQVAKTFNLEYFIIDDHEKIDNTVAKVFDSNGPALIEVVCNSEQKLLVCESI